ncbi:MAG: hypothetical protein AUG04_11020 [Deltaproteobacteria bacterium 13_1_20CM_2_69_21]|nr:MAG: hypothetical protein AUG04_11020 [Deltaproteobacteria bacterium 13_1_20CM_2_69_21]
MTMAPGARYRAGWLYSFFLGEHWRDVWTTPIEVPVLDLEAFDGGLRPDRLVGGLETKNLHFKSGNRRTWAFRSVDKDPTRVLDPDTRESLIGDLFQDETSTANPYGALMVPPLLDVADIHHATPQLVVLPDDPRLAEFHDFAGMLGLMEERMERGLEGATKVADTPTLFQRLEQRSDERVDARAYLRARLIDVLVGDWDRHIDQWRWVRYEQDGKRIWEPVPRDRDQAFSRFDGAVPSLVEYYTKQIAGFGPSYAPIDKLTFAGRFTDRRFLVGLEKTEWEAVTSELVSKLTDSVISDAVHHLPQAVYAQKGADLEKALRSRRDALPAASRDYYRLLADQVDVRGTETGEEFQIERQAGGAVEVAIYTRDPETGKRAGSPYFRRTFLSEDTSEIRLYTMGGADRILVDGVADQTIRVRVVAPPKTVEVSDRSSQPSAIHVYAPLKDPPPSASALEASASPLPNPKPDAALAHHYETFRDWGSDALFYPQLSYDGDRGLVAGATLQRTGYGFQLDPVSSVMNFGAAWSTGTNRPRLEYSADVRTRSPARGLLYIAYSGMDTVKYFGLGNETPRDSALQSAGFYNVRQGVFVANPQIEVPFVGPLHARVGVLFKHASSVDDSRILATTRPEGSGGMTLGSGEVVLAMDTRAGSFPSTRGLFLQVTGRHTPEIFSNPAAFSKLRGEASASFGWHFVTDMQFNARVAGEKNWGRYPFFESAFIGGAAQRLPLDLTGASVGNLLRGYDLNRFAGDASVVANSELQVALGKFNAALPFRYGLTALADVGRVFVANESSSKWHTGYGGGLWLGIFASGQSFQFASAIKATVVHSDEGTSFYLLSGFSL